MKKCNNFIKIISGISFTKNLVLVEKNPYLKKNLKYLVEKNNKNNKDIKIISANLSLLSDQIKHLHFRKSFNMINIIKKDIRLYGNNLNQFINEYNESTKFHQIISHLYLHYFEIYENLLQIYNGVKLTKSIKKIDFLFSQYKNNLLKLNSMSLVFDLNQTLLVLDEMNKQTNECFSFLEKFIKLHLAQKYLQNLIKKIDFLFKTNFTIFTANELEIIEKNKIYLEDEMKKFNYFFQNIDFTNAFGLVQNLCHLTNKIYHFVFIHIKSLPIITKCQKIIFDQTNDILLSKDKIFEVAKQIKLFFKNKNSYQILIDECTKKIIEIETIYKQTQTMKIVSYQDKNHALSLLFDYSNKISILKKQMQKNIEQINDFTRNFIFAIENLNNLYAFHYQLLAIVNDLNKNDNAELNEMKATLLHNIQTINRWFTTFVLNQEINFNEFNSIIIDLDRQLQVFCKKIKQKKILQQYAYSLIIYINRFQQNSDYEQNFLKISSLYQGQKYEQCIDLILSIHWPKDHASY